MANEKETISVVPKEYVDSGKKYPIEQFRKDRAKAAVELMQNSRFAAQSPEGWDETHKDPYLACLGTATGMYGENCKVHSNERFIDENDEHYFKKKGFAIVPDGEDWQEGDIIQYSDSVRPKHAVMYVGRGSKYNEPLVSYASGTAGAPLKKNRYEGTLHAVYGKQYPRRVYRYAGTESELAELEKYNKEIDMRSVPYKSAAKDIEHKEANLIPEVNETASWLNTLLKRKK